VTRPRSRPRHDNRLLLTSPAHLPGKEDKDSQYAAFPMTSS
jgi:hypothetical protein